jgi:deoxyhypusine synthase
LRTENIHHRSKNKPKLESRATPVSFKYFKKKSDEINLSKEVRIKREAFLSDPIKPLDLESTTTIAELVEAWKNTGIQSRSIANCAEVYENMLLDEARPTVFLGVSGALLAGGLRKVLHDMIDKGIVDVLVSTGAILYQDFYNSLGYFHFKGTPNANDSLLHDLYIDRIYDAYVDEVGFVDTDDKIAEIASELEPRTYSTREFMNILGGRVKDENSILYAAFKRNIPVFCPAIADSSIGISFAGLYRAAKEHGRKIFSIDTARDNYEIAQIVLKSKKTGAIYVGGGVPKNYINDASVMLDYTPGHAYAFQLTADAPHWGGLTGSTLDEATSWGKISKKATRATAYVEVTIGLPLVAGYIFEKGIWKNRKKLEFSWKADELRLKIH